MNLLNIKKQFLVLCFCVLSFNFFYSKDITGAQAAEVVTALLKYPLAFNQNYLECANKLKQAKKAELAYLANEIINIGLKINNSKNDVSFLEIGYGIYDLVQFIKAIDGYSKTDFKKLEKEFKELQKENSKKGIKPSVIKKLFIQF